MTCLAVAQRDCDAVLAVSFDYGQKHAVELEAAKNICEKWGVGHEVVDLKPILQRMKSSALVTHGDTTQPHPILAGVPASFVPVRNALFLTAAFGFAIEYKCEAIYTGVCQTDYSGYPDCRYEFISALENALRIGYNADIDIVTPLMFIDKAETFKLAEDLEVLDDVLEYSVTCYNGVVDQKHRWGLGCGECPACKLRMEGYERYLAMRG